MKINKGDIWNNRSNTWVALIMALLLFMSMVGLTQKADDPAIQAVVDSVSKMHYRAYHIYVESMGLGLYGGAKYNMGYRNRDGWEGLGTLGNQEARLFLQDKLKDMGLKVSLQGKYLYVVAELTGT